MFFIVEEAKEIILDFLKEADECVPHLFCFNKISV